MELERHLGVLWRHRILLGISLLIGVTLAFLAAYKVPDMSRRGTEVFSSTSTVMVTQSGFPWGRVILPSSAAVSGATAIPPTAGQTPAAKPKTAGSDGAQVDFADPGRFSNLATVYSILTKSDAIR